MTRRKAEEPATQTEAAGPSADELIRHVQDTMGGEVVDESTDAPAKRPFQVGRGGTQRFKQPVQYRKLTDADLGIILFKFVLPEGLTTLPADVKEILDAHKRYPESGEPTGLHFEDSRKHGKSWVIRNDAEGRDAANKIDYALNKLAAKHNLQAEQAAGGGGRGQ